jgi:hypothetical protein
VVQAARSSQKPGISTKEFDRIEKRIYAKKNGNFTYVLRLIVKFKDISSHCGLKWFLRTTGFQDKNGDVSELKTYKR